MIPIGKKLGRRAVLRGAGGAIVSLPFLGAMLGPRRSVAGPGEVPKRLVVFFTANGTIADAWRPSGGETDFTLNEIMRPLERHRDDLVILEGVDMVSAVERSGGRNGHDIGTGHALVARPLVAGPSGFGEFGHLWDGSAGGISLDQRAADVLGDGSRFGSLVFGNRSDIRQAIASRVSWRDVFEPVTPMQDPGAAFDRIFGGGVTDPTRLIEQKEQRQSVLDAVMDDYRRLDSRLGADDRRKLAAHLDALREVETSIAAFDPGRACELPGRETSSSYPEIGRINMDLMIMSMACELTPVTVHQWGTGQAGVTMSWLGHNRGHHSISHDGDGNAESQRWLQEINTWYSEQLAYLLDGMKGVTEADGGSLLDHSVVLWCNEIGKGNDHTKRDIPYVLAGGAGGALRTGRYLRFGDAAHGDLLTAILNAVGVDDATFGDPDFCTGPLTGLLG